MDSQPLITLSEAKKLEEKHKAASRKKALGLAAAAAAAAAVPIAAEVIVQKPRAAESKVNATNPAVPEPDREEYMKPRPVKGITELLQEHSDEIKGWSE